VRKALSQNTKEKSVHLKLTGGPFNMNEEGITSPCDLFTLLIHGDNGEGDQLIQFRGGCLSLNEAVPGIRQVPAHTTKLLHHLAQRGKIGLGILKGGVVTGDEVNPLSTQGGQPRMQGLLARRDLNLRPTFRQDLREGNRSSHSLSKGLQPILLKLELLLLLVPDHLSLIQQFILSLFKEGLHISKGGVDVLGGRVVVGIHSPNQGFNYANGHSQLVLLLLNLVSELY